MFAVTGRGTTIVEELVNLTGEPAVRIGGQNRYALEAVDIPAADRYVLAAGIMHGVPISEQTPHRMIEACAVNMLDPIRICEFVLATNPTARICVVGSQSAISGSFDPVYLATKAGLHAYVLTKRLRPPQQLVCVAPTIIADAGMTYRRHDYPEVLEKRFTVRALDVARAIKRVLWDNGPTRVEGDHSHCWPRIVQVIERTPP